MKIGAQSNAQLDDKEEQNAGWLQSAEEPNPDTTTRSRTFLLLPCDEWHRNLREISHKSAKHLPGRLLADWPQWQPKTGCWLVELWDVETEFRLVRVRFWPNGRCVVIFRAEKGDRAEIVQELCEEGRPNLALKDGVLRAFNFLLMTAEATVQHMASQVHNPGTEEKKTR